jgi:hypothetical protein
VSTVQIQICFFNYFFFGKKISKLGVDFVSESLDKFCRAYVLDLALDAEDGLVGGGAEVDHPVVQPLILPDMNELLPCLCVKTCARCMFAVNLIMHVLQ